VTSEQFKLIFYTIVFFYANCFCKYLLAKIVALAPAPTDAAILLQGTDVIPPKQISLVKILPNIF
tara:strand:- start:856 stop:1050 length:195 start_codon:yes stop_codon:yes gene_type:complete